MIFITVVCVCLIIALGYALRQNAEKEREWVRERQLLLSRIQHPEVYVQHLEPGTPEAEAATRAEPEEDEIDLIGTIVGEEQADG